METSSDTENLLTITSSKYSKYLSKAVNYPDKKTVKNVLNSIIPCNEVLCSKEYCKLQENGYHQYESGYSVMPNGTGYIAFCIDLPDATPEMFDWFFSWHPVEPERYRIMNPEEHINAFITEEDRNRLIDNRLPYNERLWGVHVLYSEKTEDNEIHDLLLSYNSPYESGFSKNKPCKCKWTAVCGNEGSICYFVREKKGGAELRARIWAGIDTQEAEEEHSLPESYLSIEDTEFFIKKTAVHFITDFSNLSSILPSLYRDYCTN